MEYSHVFNLMIVVLDDADESSASTTSNASLRFINNICHQYLITMAHGEVDGSFSAILLGYSDVGDLTINVIKNCFICWMMVKLRILNLKQNLPLDVMNTLK